MHHIVALQNISRSIYKTFFTYVTFVSQSEMHILSTSQEMHILATSTATLRRQVSIFMSTSAEPRRFQNTPEYFILVVLDICGDSFISRRPPRRNVIV